MEIEHVRCGICNVLMVKLSAVWVFVGGKGAYRCWKHVHAESKA